MARIITILLLFICSIGYGQKQSIVLYHKCENTTGTTSRDERGISPGTIDGADLNQTGISGKCYGYVNANADVVTMDNSIPATSGNFTFNAWIKIASVSAFRVIMGERNDVSLNWYYLTVVSDGTVQFRVRGNTIVTTTSTATVDDNSWHMVTGVYNSTGNASVYIDGDFETSSAAETLDWTSMPDFGIGDFINKADLLISFQGLIDEVMVYGTDINQSFIYQLFNEGNSRLYVFENVINGKITYKEFINYEMDCFYNNLKDAA